MSQCSSWCRAVAIPRGSRWSQWAGRCAPALARRSAAPCPSAAGKPHRRLTGYLYQSLPKVFRCRASAPRKAKCRSMNPGIRARRDVTYASRPWSTACCTVWCSPLCMRVEPENARSAIGVSSLARSARTIVCFSMTISHAWTDTAGVPRACGSCQPSKKPGQCLCDHLWEGAVPWDLIACALGADCSPGCGGAWGSRGGGHRRLLQRAPGSPYRCLIQSL
jgi:hypothetical protein